MDTFFTFKLKEDGSKRTTAKPRSGSLLAVCLRFGAHSTVESVSVLPESRQLELQASECSKKSMAGARNNTFATERN